jgi:superfamily II DNA or RNA helicase
VKKTKYNIILFLILFASTLTLNAHNFLHHHETEFDNKCYFCIISLSLISDDDNTDSHLLFKSISEFTLLIFDEIHLINNFYKNVSDRAPPVNLI